MTEVSGGYLAQFVRGLSRLVFLAGLPMWTNWRSISTTACCYSRSFLDARWLGHEAADRLRVVDALLEEMSFPNNERLWGVEALAVAPEWEAVRAAARHALLAV